MTAHGDCAHCGAICEPGYGTCSAECNVAYRASEPKQGIGDVPEGYFTLSEIAVKLGLSQATLYARKISGKPFPKGISGHYSLEEVAALGIKPRAKRGLQEVVEEPFQAAIAESAIGVACLFPRCPETRPHAHDKEFPTLMTHFTPPEPQVVIVEGRSLEERKQALTEGIAQINRRLPEAIRESMIRAARDAAKDACLVHAEEARRRGDHWLRAQCLEDFVHMDECLKITFNEKEAR